MPPSQDPRAWAPVLRLKRHLDQEVWLRQLIVPLWAGATAVLLLRLLLGASARYAYALVGIAVLLGWWWLARARVIPLGEAAVLADRAAGAGGLLLTQLERPLGSWERELGPRVGELKLPARKLWRPLAFSLAALGFLGVALWIPMPQKRSRPNAAAAVKLEAIEQRAEALAQERALPPSLEEELARLREELEDERFDAADWEAAEAVDSALAEGAAEAAQELDAAAEAALALEQALAENGAAEGVTREIEELERALAELGPMGGGSAEAGAQEASSGAGAAGQAGAQGQQQAGAQGQQGQQQAGAQGQQGQQQAGAQGQQGQQQAGAQGQQGQQQAGAQGQQGQQGQQQAGAQGQQGQQGQQQAGAQGQQGQQQAGAGIQQGQQGQQQAGAQGQQGQQGQQQSGAPRTAERAEQLRRALEARRQALAQAYGQQPSGAPQAGQGQGQPGQQSGAESGSSQDSAQGESTSASSGQQGASSRGGGEGEHPEFSLNDLHPERLRFAPLPQGQGGPALEVWGIQNGDPSRVQVGSSDSASGVAAPGEQSPGVGDRELLPRNRDLVRRYFGSTGEK